MIDLRGLHAHIGSQITNLDQFEAEVAALATLGEFQVYDLGGGLGVRYEPGDVAPTSTIPGAAHRGRAPAPGPGHRADRRAGPVVVAPAG